MSKLDDLHTLVRLLKQFEFPVSPILEYAIKEKEEELSAECAVVEQEISPSAGLNIDITADEPVSFASLKDAFRNYLYRTKSPRTAHNYLHYIEKPIRVYIGKIVDSEADSIYSFKTISEVRAMALKLKADDSFVADNLKWHNALTAAITCYTKFLEIKDNL